MRADLVKDLGALLREAGIELEENDIDFVIQNKAVREWLTQSIREKRKEIERVLGGMPSKSPQSRVRPLERVHVPRGVVGKISADDIRKAIREIRTSGHIGTITQEDVGSHLGFKRPSTFVVRLCRDTALRDAYWAELHSTS